MSELKNVKHSLNFECESQDLWKTRSEVWLTLDAVPPTPALFSVFEALQGVPGAQKGQEGSTPTAVGLAPCSLVCSSFSFSGHVYVN